MFGLLRGYFPKDNRQSRELYNSIYCASCYALAENLGAMGRFLLSYELAAAFSLAVSLHRDDFSRSKFFCPLSGLKYKRKYDFNREFSQRLIDLYLTLIGLKLQDNLIDEKGFKSFLSKVENRIFIGRIQSAEKRLIESNFPIDEAKFIISEFNKNRVSSLDDVTKPSGKLFSLLGVEIARITNRDDILGEMKFFSESVGRTFALVDMLDDLRSDMKRNRPNPLVSLYGTSSSKPSDIIQNAKDDISYLSREYLNDVAISLSELKPYRNHDILRDVFGRSLERALMRHFSRVSRSGKIVEEAIA